MCKETDSTSGALVFALLPSSAWAQPAAGRSLWHHANSTGLKPTSTDSLSLRHFPLNSNIHPWIHQVSHSVSLFYLWKKLKKKTREIVVIIAERQLENWIIFICHNCECVSCHESMLEPAGQMGGSWAPPSDFHNWNRKCVIFFFQKPWVCFSQGSSFWDFFFFLK